MESSTTSSAITSRPEHELLVCSLQTPTGDDCGRRLRALVEAVGDWDYLFRLARRHAVVPLLFVQLQRVSEAVPTEAFLRFKRNYQENAARNLVLTSELCRLIELFREAGIEAIPYKGPVLALRAYGDIALRRFVDLDIMVRKADVVAARDILVKEGFTPSKSLNNRQQEVLLRTQHNLQFRRNNQQLIVELHWEVASHLFASSVRADELWENLTPLQLNGTEVKSLAIDDLLFSLCVHGSRHLWERLSWISDVGRIVESFDISWSTLLRRADQTHTRRMFLLGLYLAAELLKTPLPTEVFEKLRGDQKLTELANRIIVRLFNGTEHIPATASEILKYNLSVREEWRARARYSLFMFAPTDGDLSVISLPQPLTFAYYLLRPVRMLITKRNAH